MARPAGIVESLGASAQEVERPSDPASLLEDGLRSNRLNIIDVPVNYAEGFD
jgi:thiamine pyrophosphate-dependent acetolactate synthase large subunit-like protein